MTNKWHLDHANPTMPQDLIPSCRKTNLRILTPSTSIKPSMTSVNNEVLIIPEDTIHVPIDHSQLAQREAPPDTKE